MDQKLADLKEKLGDKWSTFDKLHRIILSVKRGIEYRIFPIYVSYFLGDNMVAVAYYRGKFRSDGKRGGKLDSKLLDAGFALKKKPKISGFVSAKHMKYPGITYSIKLGSPNDITKEFVQALKSIADKVGKS